MVTVNRTAFVALCLVLSTGTTFAQSRTVADLDKVLSETYLLKAEAKRQEAANDVASKRAAGSGEQDFGLPVAKSVIIKDGRAVVKFLFSGGATAEGSAGEILPGGFRVVAVHAEDGQIKLAKGKDTFTVGMSAAAPTQRISDVGNQFGGPRPIVPSSAILPGGR